MALTYADVVHAHNNQMLEILTTWQQVSVDTFRGFTKMMNTFLPDLNVYHEMPTFLQDSLGDPEAILDDNYGFALAVLDLQRKFMLEVFRGSPVAPRTPYVPPSV